MSYDKYRIKNRGSRSVQVLEEAWSAIKKVNSRVPDVVLTLVNSASGRRVGYTHLQQWRYMPGKMEKPEVALSPRLFHSPSSALSVLLHEAAHGALIDFEYPLGCGPDGYYHRHEFRDIVRAYGLQCEFRNNRYGWCNTGWGTEGMPPIYHNALRILQQLPEGTGNDVVHMPPTRKLPKSGHVRLVCGCKKQRSIYASVSVVRKRNILCTSCNEQFRLGE